MSVEIDVVIVRVPVVSPDGGAAWRALYEGKAVREPVEDSEGASHQFRREAKPCRGGVDLNLSPPRPFTPATSQ